MTAKTVRAASLLVLCVAVLIASIPPTAEAEVRNAGPGNDDGLEAELEGYISGLGATYGVAAVSLSDGSTVFVNDENLFPTASMYKLLVMYQVFQAMDNVPVA